MRRAVMSVWAVIATIFFVQTANGLQTSLLSFRAALEGFTPVVIGIVMASYYVGYSAAPLASRFIIGRAGHVRTMAFGIAAAAVVIALHPLLIAPAAWAVLRLVSGFVLSSGYVAAESWIHDRVANDKRGRVFSLYMVAQMIAMTLAQLLLMTSIPKSAWPFLIAAAIFAIGVIPIVYARNTAPDWVPPDPFGLVRLFRASPLGAVVTVLAGVSWSIVFTFGTIYAQRSGFDVVHVSLFMALAMVGGALIQFPFGSLSDAIGRRPTLAIMSAGGIAVSLLGLWADGQGDLAKYAASFFVGGFIFPIYAISAAHTNDAIAPQNRVAAAAGLVLLFGLGSIFGPLAVGGVVTAMGAAGFYVVLAATLAASLAATAITR